MHCSYVIEVITMKIKKGASKLIHYFHLDVKYCLLTGKMVKILYEFFQLLDIHNCNALNGMSLTDFL